MSDTFDRLKQALADRYAIERELGSGGMATVYLAEDLKHHRQVALKVLRPELSAVLGPARFLQEIEVAAKLTHPRVLPLHDSGEADGLLFYVMPYVAGESLRDRINREGQLAIDDAVTITRAVATALDHAHRRGIVHRDIKPENILLHEGEAVITDFGIALAVREAGGERLTETGLSLGTPSYMSPEQAAGNRTIDVRTDIYSLGCVLYEMLAGDPPFTGSNVQAVLAKVLTEKPTPIGSIRDTTPNHVQVAIEKALAKAPADRFESATAFAEALTTAGAVAESMDRVLTSRPLRWQSVLPYAVALGAVTLLIWVVGGRGNDSASELLSGNIRPLTNFEGVEWAASWSPDASMIAYIQIHEGDANIVTLSTGGGAPHALTDNPADEVIPRWSPDGSKIAFISDRGTGSNIYWIPASGGAEHKVAETNIPFLEHIWAWVGALGASPWSADGEELLFSRLHETGEVAIWKVNLVTGVETQLTHPRPGVEDLTAAWSFDGTQIVFSRGERGRRSLWLLSAEGGEPTPLLIDEHTNFDPAWLPDDKHIVFASARSGALNLWRVEIDSKALRQVTAGTGNDYAAAVSAGGSIAFTQFNHQVDVYLMRVDAPQAEHERLTAFTVGDDFAPRISPDGRQVVYHSNRTGNYELYVVDRESGVHRQITDHPGADALADWSPDGSELAFLSNRSGDTQMWTVRAEGGAPRLVIDVVLPWTDPTAIHFGGPRWSPDGNTIGYVAPTAEGDAIWLVSPNGDRSRATNALGVIGFDWYLDDRRVVYTRRAQSGSGGVEMVAAHLETGDEIILFKGQSGELIVSPDGAAVAFLWSASHYNMDTYVLGLERPSTPDGLPRPLGEPQQITFGQGLWHVHSGGWSPDGREIVYSRDADVADIYVIGGNR